MMNHGVGRFRVHRSESGAALVAGLADLLAAPLSDSFTPEVVAVPTQGIERWLAQRLSHRLGAGDTEDGVCANVLFPHPNDVLDEALAAVREEHAATVEVWQPARTVWQLVERLDELTTSGDERFALLRHHLTTGQEIPTGRRYALARRIVGLFNEYASARPDMIRAWTALEDREPEDLAWQPVLWRAVRAELGPNPAELLDSGLTAIREHPDRVALPERFSVYGTSRIDASRLQVLAALAAHRDVHLWLNHASPQLWDDVTAAQTQPSLRRADATVQARNPLLASLSRDIRELQQRLTIVAPNHTSSHHPAPDPADEPADQRAAQTLLLRLQHTLRADAEPGHDYEPDAKDRSIQVHACHGRARQVEVLRDVALGLLADDPSLEPRDVLVMCPDVDAFAPLVTAGFGSEPADRLRVQLADRAPRESNPVLAAVTAMLELVAGRVGAPELLAFAGMPPVRARFGLDDDDLEQLRSWTVEAAARWGLDTDYRKTWQLSSLRDGTWRQAFDRILTGIALGDGDHLWAGVLPLDGLDSGDIDLAGRFAELVDRVAAAVDALTAEQPAGQWIDRVEQAALSLVDVPRDQAWQVLQLRAELGEIRDALDGNGPRLALADVRALLDDRLAGRPTRTSFRTGGITVCSLVPMRSVPHRVICLLGLDDESFPRLEPPGRRQPAGPRPAPGRARPAQRGPPAVPRRDHRRDRAPRHHLPRGARMHRRTAPTSRPRRRAARRPGRAYHDRVRHPRTRGRTPSPAAGRSTQLHRRRTRSYLTVRLRPERARGRTYVRTTSYAPSPLPRPTPTIVAPRHRRTRCPATILDEPGRWLPSPTP